MISKTPIISLVFAFVLPFTGIAQSPTYDISADITEGCDSISVKFTFVDNALEDTIDFFFWDFGNGKSSLLRDPDPVIYDIPMPYSVALVFGSTIEMNESVIKNEVRKVSYKDITRKSI